MENDHKESVTESATGEAANDDSQNVSENEKAMVEEPKKDEHPIFKFIEEGNLDAVQKQIDVEGVSIETEDSHGMTPLMHASWKGRTDIVEFLLKQGASPNGGNHEHDYTCLHFAGLAGSTEICRMLLEAGAKPYHTNSVNRTAAAMAAFVGNHSCVAVINNFVSKEEVWFYTRKQPLESEPKLPQELAKSVYKIVMSMNTNPVRIGLILREEPKLVENIKKVANVLELMSDKQFKNRQDVNEILSLKFHIIHYILKGIMKEKEIDEKRTEEKKTPFIDRWIKGMLLGRDTDGFSTYQENFLRQGIKEFPFPESQLFKMLVTNFSQCKNYGEGQTAAEYINAAFNGQKGFKDFENCASCGEEKAEKKCSSCKAVFYCDQVCQKLNWFMHKKFCAAMKIQQEKVDALKKENEKNDKESAKTQADN